MTRDAVLGVGPHPDPPPEYRGREKDRAAASLRAGDRPRLVHYLALLLITLLAAAARFWHLSANAPHFDEIWHLESSTGRGSMHEQLPDGRLTIVPPLTSLRDAPPWWAIWTHMSGETHPPLYEMTLRAWRDVFGQSLYVGRTMSAVLSTLCVPLMFWMVLPLHGRTASLLAALLMAVSSPQVEQAQEVRHYPLATIFVLLTAGALLRLPRTSRPRATIALIFIAATLSLFTLYFTAPALAAMGAYALVRLRGRRRAGAAGALIASVIVFAALWFPQMLRQRPTVGENASHFGFGETEPNHLVATARRLAVLPVRLLFEPAERDLPIFIAGGVIVLILPLLLLRREPGLLLWSLWLWTAAACATALDLLQYTRHLEVTRHMVLASPAVCAIVATMFAALWPRARTVAWLIPALIAAACLAALPATYQRDTARFAELGRALSASRPGEPVLFSAASPQQADWACILYLGCSYYAADTFPRPAGLLMRPADAALVAELRKHHQFWLVAGNGAPSPEQLIPGIESTPVGGEPYLGMVYRLHWQ